MQGQNILMKASATVEMKPTTFNSGSDGFRGQGKVMEGETKYQVQILAIRVGSKPNGKKSKNS